MQVKRKEPQELAEDVSLKRVRPSTPPDEEDEGEIFRPHTDHKTGAIIIVSAESDFYPQARVSSRGAFGHSAVFYPNLYLFFVYLMHK